MYKKFDQVGEQEEGLNPNQVHIVECSIKTIRDSLVGVTLAAGFTTLGLKHDNDALVGIGMTMAYLTVLVTIKNTRKFMQE
jgi:hypothetical protein